MRVETWANFASVKISVSVYGHVSINIAQLGNQLDQSLFLFWSSCVSCDAMLVETSDVCNADRVFVVVSSVAMGTDVFQRTSSFDVAVLKNDKMVPYILVPASTM